MSNKLDLEIKQGEDFYRLLTLKDENSSPIELTGYTFAGQVRASSLADLFLSFTFTIKNQVTYPGQVEMKISAAASSLKIFPQGGTVYQYDVEMNDGSATTRILEGFAKLNPGMTR